MIGTDGLFDKWEEKFFINYLFKELQKGNDINMVTMNIFHNLVSKSVDGSGGKGLDNMSCAVVDLNKLR